MGREPEVEAAMKYVAATIRLIRNAVDRPRSLSSESYPGVEWNTEAHRRALGVLWSVISTDVEARHLWKECDRLGERIWRERGFLRHVELGKRQPLGIHAPVARASGRDVGADENPLFTDESRRAAAPPLAAHYALYFL